MKKVIKTSQKVKKPQAKNLLFSNFPVILALILGVVGIFSALFLTQMSQDVRNQAIMIYPRTPVPQLRGCSVSVNNHTYRVEVDKCGCGISGYEEKKCDGNNTWTSRPNICNAQCNPQNTFPPGTSCSDTRLDYPEPLCEGMKVGDKCGAQQGATCTVVTYNNSERFCDCTLTK